MPVTIACPYCRSPIPVENLSAARVVCPQCGETVSVQSADRLAEMPVITRGETLTSPPWFKPAFYASCLLSALLLIGGLWWVYSDRPPPQVPPPARTVDGIPPPVAWSGLGYLPGSVQLVAAVRPGPLLAYGPEVRSDPRQRLSETGIPKPVLDALDRLGVPLGQIDHVAVGLSLPPDDAFPRVVLTVVFTEPPSDEAVVLKAVGAERVTGGDFPRYKVTLGGLPMQLVRATPSAYVFATEPKDLEGFDRPRPVAGEQFRSTLRDAVTLRLSPASFAWVAAVGDDGWTKLPSVKLAAQFFNRNDLLPRFAPGRACVIGLSLESVPTVRIAVNAADAAAVGDWLGQQWAGEATEIEVGEGWAGAVTRCKFAEVPARIGGLIPPVRK